MLGPRQVIPKANDKKSSCTDVCEDEDDSKESESNMNRDASNFIMLKTNRMRPNQPRECKDREKPKLKKSNAKRGLFKHDMP